MISSIHCEHRERRETVLQGGEEMISFNSKWRSFASDRMLRSSRVLATCLAVILACGGIAGCSKKSFKKPATTECNTGNVVVDCSSCPAATKPVWLAFQDGTSSAWTQVVPTNDVYRFNITQANGGIAVRRPGGAGTGYTQVFFFSRAELTALTSAFFCTAAGSKTNTGTVAGLEANNIAVISLGGASAVPTVNGAFALSNISDGSHDLVAVRQNVLNPGLIDRVIVRRDLNIANNGSLGVVDFGSAESAAPTLATVTVVGASEPYIIQTGYLLGCQEAATLAQTPSPGTLTQMTGVPSSLQRASDFHSVGIIESHRSVQEYFHTMADRTFTLGAALPTPTVTVLPAAYKRLQFTLTLPAEYQRIVTAFYGTSGDPTSIIMVQSFAYQGSASVTLASPDLSGATGWQNAWAPAASSAVNWRLSAAGGDDGCGEGARFVAASATGTTP